MYKEALTSLLLGKFQDTILNKDGNIEVLPWKNNQIQNTEMLLAMRLMKEIKSGQVAGIGGFQYLAVGQGQASWDLSAPTKAYSQSTLVDEVDRIAIDPDTDIVYLDPTTEAVSGSPTRMVEISVYIDFNRGVDAISGTADLREFALVGGNATTVADTGLMINWADHTKIEKDTTKAIQRTIRIKRLTVEEAIAFY